MKIGILGAGMVGQTLGTKLIELGHEVGISTREPQKLTEWLASVDGQAKVGTIAEIAAFGEILFNCTNGQGSIAALQSANERDLAGKILVDISNPLDFSKGMPPTLFVCNDNSLGEEIQAAFPAVSVVKTLNTVTAALMVNPALLAEEHSIFVCGNDAVAKGQVVDILQNWFGWQSVIDLGDISNARATEMLLPIWVRLWGKLQTGLFNFKIVQQ